MINKFVNSRKGSGSDAQAKSRMTLAGVSGVFFGVFLAMLLFPPAFPPAAGSSVFSGSGITITGITAYAKEGSEEIAETTADSQTDAAEESETEISEDDSDYTTVIAEDPMSAAIVAASQMGSDATNEILTKDMVDEINSMSKEEMAEYLDMAMKVLENPDFQSLLEYEEVRDLTVLLIHNALDFASEDPKLTNKILTTMGVDPKAIAVLLYLLDLRADNIEVVEQLMNYVTSDEADLLLEVLLKEYREYGETGKVDLTDVLESVSTESESAENGSGEIGNADSESVKSGNADSTDITKGLQAESGAGK